MADPSTSDDTTPRRPVVVVSWNLQGSQGVDVEGVADVLSVVGADVIVIQEIQRRQARRLAKRLGITEMRWVFKHFPLNTWSEGLAVLTPHRLADSDSFVLRRAWFWNWRRRVGLAARIERGDDDQFGIINVHLSPHDAGDERRREAHLVVERARSEPDFPLIAGDFNDLPGGPGYQVFTGSGWSDAWLIDTLKDIDGPTNWTSGARLGRAPTQRLDFVFAPTGWDVADARVLADPERPGGEPPGEPTPCDGAFVSAAEPAEQAERDRDAVSWRNAPLKTLSWFAERSDHVPLLAEVRPPTKDPR